jgi:hypothetical protein
MRKESKLEIGKPEEIIEISDPLDVPDFVPDEEPAEDAPVLEPVPA